MSTLAKRGTDAGNAARTAGISLVIMAIAAAFSYGYVHGELVIVGDAGATFHNIQSSGALFKTGVLGWFVIMVTDILAAWALYIFLKPVNEGLSLLGAWLRLIYAVMLGIAISHLVIVLLLTSDTGMSVLLVQDQLQAQVMLHLKAFESLWSFGLILFGGHLLVVGWLALKSTQVPKILAILLMIAAAGYIVIHLGNTFFPQLDYLVTLLEYVFSAPMIVGELGFGIWLLVKGSAV